MVSAVLAIILTLVLVVGLHEAGHAIAARFFAIKIKRISIGFGKPLLQWTSRNGCEWVWSIWPLGGYAQLLNTRISPVDPAEHSLCFDKKPIWQRVLVLVAGSATNLLIAWFAFVFLFLLGINYKSPDIQTVQKNSIAARAGILAGDQFISINGDLTPSWREVGMKLIGSWGQKEVNVAVQRSPGDIRKVVLNLSQQSFAGSERSLLDCLGITPSPTSASKTLRAPNLWSALRLANGATCEWLHFFLIILKQLFSGVIPFSLLLGPIGLFAASIQSFTQGLVMFMYFIASLSLAVGLINLFPIPGLDGGSIAYLGLEKLRGKPLSVAMELLLYRLVLIAFALVLVQLLLNDLQRFLT